MLHFRVSTGNVLPFTFYLSYRRKNGPSKVNKHDKLKKGNKNVEFEVIDRSIKMPSISVLFM